MTETLEDLRQGIKEKCIKGDGTVSLKIEELNNKEKLLLWLYYGGSLIGDGEICQWSFTPDLYKYPNGLCNHFRKIDTLEEKMDLINTIANELDEIDKAILDLSKTELMYSFNGKGEVIYCNEKWQNIDDPATGSCGPYCECFPNEEMKKKIEERGNYFQ